MQNINLFATRLPNPIAQKAITMRNAEAINLLIILRGGVRHLHTWERDDRANPQVWGFGQPHLGTVRPVSLKIKILLAEVTSVFPFQVEFSFCIRYVIQFWCCIYCTYEMFIPDRPCITCSPVIRCPLSPFSAMCRHDTILCDLAWTLCNEISVHYTVVF